MIETESEIKKLFFKDNVKKYWYIKVYDTSISSSSSSDDSDDSLITEDSEEINYGEVETETELPGANQFVLELTNDDLISESISINEKMCSSDTLKFGLCEGTCIEFQYFGDTSIKDYRIHVQLAVEGYVREDQRIDLGWFDVDSCIAQAGTTLKKVVAYNKLKSAYLDADATEEIQELTSEGESGVTGSISVSKVIDTLLDGYSFDTIDTQTAVSTSLTTGVNYNVADIKTYNEYGEATGMYLHVFTLSKTWQADDASTSNYYKYFINSSDIEAYIKNHCLYGSLIVAAGESYISIDDCRENEYSDALSLSGFCSITNSEGVRIYGRKFYKDKTYMTEWLINHTGIYITVPVIYTYDTSSTASITDSIKEEMETAYETFVNAVEMITIYERVLPIVAKVRFTTDMVSNLSEVTLRDLQAAVYETECKYGKLDKASDKFSGNELNYGGLYPADTLYPDSALYPSGEDYTARAKNYRSLYMDAEKQLNFRYLIITYKTTDDDGNETEATLQRTVNTDGTNDYNMSDNWLLKNFTWTADEVGAIADSMVTKMQNMTWVTYELDSIGIPYLECGDMIELKTADKSFVSYILERTLKGLQVLEDNMNFGSVDTF